MNKNISGFLFATISAAGFALMGISGMSAYREGISTYNLLTWRFLISFLMLLLWFLIFKRDRLCKLTLFKPFILGAIGYAGQAYLYFTTIKYLSTGITATLLYTYPSIVAILTFATDKIKPTKSILMGIVLSFIGIALLTNLSGTVSIAGIGLGLSLALWYSGYIRVSEKFLKGADTFETSLLLFLGASTTFGLLAAFDNSLAVPKNYNQWMPIITLAFFSTLIAISFFFLAIQRIGSVRSSLLSTLEPVLTIIFGVIFLKEQMTTTQIIGVATVLSAVVITLKTSNQNKNAS